MLFAVEESEVLAMLDRLREEYPAFEIWSGYLEPRCWVWFARGREGNPWLIMSGDPERFKRWLAAENTASPAPRL